MQTTEFIWFNGKYIPWAEATTHVLTHTLHYGGGAFEGIRVYDTAKGPAVFRLAEHIKRLFYSAGVLRMEIPFSQEQLVEATCELLRRNKMKQGYIRPLIYYGYGVMGLRPVGAPVESMIACWPWGQYLPHDMVDVKVSQYMRIEPRSTVVDAKICGHYVNSILASIEIRDTEFHEALLLDNAGNIAEGPGENFFAVFNNELHTPSLGAILAGITRQTVMTIAKDLGYKTVERKITLEEVWGKASEVFFTGTAAEVTPVRTIDRKLIGEGEIGPVTALIKKTYLDTVYGRNEKYREFLSYI